MTADRRLPAPHNAAAAVAAARLWSAGFHFAPLLPRWRSVDAHSAGCHFAPLLPRWRSVDAHSAIPTRTSADGVTFYSFRQSAAQQDRNVVELPVSTETSPTTWLTQDAYD